MSGSQATDSRVLHSRTRSHVTHRTLILGWIIGFVVACLFLAPVSVDGAEIERLPSEAGAFHCDVDGR